jgi:hypothetical protein
VLFAHAFEKHKHLHVGLCETVSPRLSEACQGSLSRSECPNFILIFNFFAVFSALGGRRITSILVPLMVKHKRSFQANSIVDTIALGSQILLPFSV